MKDTQALSVFPGPDTGGTPSAQPAQAALVFDVCQTGMVLRAVLAVELCAAVTVGFLAVDPLDWAIRLAVVTGGALPATVAWLLMACLGKRVLERLPPQAQYGVAVALGALAGLYGCFMLVFSQLLPAGPWLASAGAGALLASAMVVVLVMRAQRQQPALASARLAELQSRIRPHFLFNTLNSAIALVRAEPAKAEALLEDLSDLFREALKDSCEPVTLAHELALARRYLAIEQVRFGERLRLHWRLDPRADGAQLPPLLLQPLVENAVRHGVEPSTEGADVHISTQRRGSTVVIKVSNTLPAGPGEPGQGLALDNVRERLSLLHDVQGQLRSQFKDGIFLVRIEVPA
ncbi:MAG: histidine kinase [Rhodoferax sp.]